MRRVLLHCTHTDMSLWSRGAGVDGRLEGRVCSGLQLRRVVPQHPGEHPDTPLWSHTPHYSLHMNASWRRRDLAGHEALTSDSWIQRSCKTKATTQKPSSQHGYQPPSQHVTSLMLACYTSPVSSLLNLDSTHILEQFSNCVIGMAFFGLYTA